MNRKMIQTVMALLILAGPFAGVSEARSRVVRWDASIQSPERGSTGHLGHAPVAPIQPKPQSKSQGEFAGKTMFTFFARVASMVSDEKSCGLPLANLGIH